MDDSFKSCQQGRTATLASCSTAFERIRSVKAPQAWAETTISSGKMVVSWIGASRKTTLPFSLGQDEINALDNFSALRGMFLSTARAVCELSSRMSIICAKRPCPQARSTILPPRYRRRTRFAISQASWNSFPGSVPARQTARAILSKRRSPGKSDCC